MAAAVAKGRAAKAAEEDDCELDDASVEILPEPLEVADMDTQDLAKKPVQVCSMIIDIAILNHAVHNIYQHRFPFYIYHDRTFGSALTSH